MTQIQPAAAPPYYGPGTIDQGLAAAAATDAAQQTLVQQTNPALLASPDPLGLTTNLGLLANNHPWMPAQAQAALAGSGLDPATMMGAAERMRQAVAAQDDGLHLFHDSPVLHKKVSSTEALHQFLTEATGTPPVGEPVLKKIQQGLQQGGYAKHLKANGLWTPDWGAEYHQAVFDAQVHHYQGKKPGGFSFGKAVGGFLHAFTPEGAWNAIIGTAKAIPGELRDIAADTVGAGVYGATLFTGLGTLASQGFGAYDRAATRAHVAAGLGVEHLLGNTSLTRSQYQHQITTRAGLGRVAQEALTVLLLDSAAGGLGKILGSATTGEAAAGEGIASRTLPKAFAPGPGAVARTVGRFAGSNVFENYPVLERIGPWLGKLADQDGLYYKARTLVAAPYKFTPVRVAGTAFGESLSLGAQARGAANLSQTLGGEPTLLSRSVQGERSVSAIDEAVKNNLEFSVFGHEIRPSLNDLMFVLHGPVGGPGAPSSAIAASSANVREGFDRMLSIPGLLAQIDHVEPVDKVAARFDTHADFLRFFNMKIDEFAVSRAATRALEEERVKLPPDRVGKINLSDADAHMQMEDEIRADPLLHQRAIDELVASRQAFEVELQKQIENTRQMATGRWGRPYDGMVDESLTKGANYMRAQHVLEDEILPFVGSGHLIHDPGVATKIGIGTNDQLLAEVAKNRLNAVREEYQALMNRGRQAAPGEDRGLRAEFDDWRVRLKNELFQEHGVDAADMPHDDLGKIDKLAEVSGRLATGLYLKGDAPPQLVAGFRKLSDMGFRPIVGGSNLGTAHSIPSDALIDLGKADSVRRRLANHLGLPPGLVNNMHPAALRDVGMTRAFRRLFEDTKDPLLAGTPWVTPATLLTFLKKKGFIDDTPSRLQAAIIGASGAARRAAAEFGISADDAARELGRPLSILDYSTERWVEALSGPRALQEFAPAIYEERVRQAEAFGDAAIASVDKAGLMSRRDALRVHRAAIRGAASAPASMVGAQKLEDLLRASMGFAGNGIAWRVPAGAAIGAGVGVAGAAYTGGDTGEAALHGAAVGAAAGALGGDRLGWAMANLPNDLIRLRNKFRFDYSPFFDLRRITKVSAKMGLEGVPFTFTPLKALGSQAAPAKQLLEEVMPEVHSEAMDGAERYLRANSLMIFNIRHFEAYAAQHLKAMGLNNSEIRDKLIRIFDYGENGEIGRSALERTMNFVFFPFSFDKTLYRNFGAYLMDRPAQRVLLTRALAAYDTYNRDHAGDVGTTQWFKDHLPILNEAVHLNAFAHGISLGEVGGINRPLLNIFLPQSWTSSNQNLDKLKRFIPAVSDFGRLWKESLAELPVAENLGHNLRMDLKGVSPTVTRPHLAVETTQAQMRDAFALQRQYFEKYQPILDYNAKHKKTPLHFPLDSVKWGRWAGEPITKTNLRDIIHLRYPGYDPQQVVAKGLAKDAGWKTYRYDLRLRNPGLYVYVETFEKMAGSLAKAMDADSHLTVEQAVEYAQQLRNAAVALSERDGAFYTIYKKKFESLLGPLEKVNL